MEPYEEHVCSYPVVIVLLSKRLIADAPFKLGLTSVENSLIELLIVSFTADWMRLIRHQYKRSRVSLRVTFIHLHAVQIIYMSLLGSSWSLYGLIAELKKGCFNRRTCCSTKVHMLVYSRLLDPCQRGRLGESSTLTLTLSNICGGREQSGDLQKDIVIDMSQQHRWSVRDSRWKEASQSDPCWTNTTLSYVTVT